ncbi:MAG: hydroxymyristoyl-ACP dehydratase [Bacteroidia bacterium]
MQVIAEGEQLLKFIPQRSPMVMIDKLFFSDADKCITGLHISEDNIFCRNGLFREPGLIENMAQTAAVHAGYNSSTQAKEGEYRGAAIGFIGAIKDLKIHFLPAVNSEIVTEIKITHQIFDATVVNAFVSCNGETAAECELKIFIKKD